MTVVPVSWQWAKYTATTSTDIHGSQVATRMVKNGDQHFRRPLSVQNQHFLWYPHSPRVPGRRWGQNVVYSCVSEMVGSHHKYLGLQLHCDLTSSRFGIFGIFLRRRYDWFMCVQADTDQPSNTPKLLCGDFFGSHNFGGTRASRGAALPT